MYNAVYCDEFGIHLNLRDLDKWIDETNERLAAVEEKVSNDVEFTFKPGRIIFGSTSITDVVDKKYYDELEAKHEADCRLISEYDLEIKRLKKQNTDQNETISYAYSNLNTEQRERIRCEAVIEDLKRKIAESEFHVEKLKEDVDRHRKHNADLKSRLFDLKNIENERDNYKSLYDKYKTLYDDSLKDETKSCHYKELFHSLNHKHQKVVGDMKHWKERAIEAEKNEDYLKNRVQKAETLNKKYDEELTAIKMTMPYSSHDYEKIFSKYKGLLAIADKSKISSWDYAELVSEYKDLEEKLENIKIENEVLSRENVFLKTQLNKFETEDDECCD